MKVSEVATLVEQEYPNEVRSIRQFASAVVASGGWSRAEELQWPAHTRNLAGPAFDAAVEVASILNFFDPSLCGTFERPTDMTGFQILIYTRNSSDSKLSSRSRLSKDEAEGWARAAMGKAWSNYAYCITSAFGPTDRWRFFVVADRDCRPTLLPNDFRFDQVPRGTPPVAWRKLAPEATDSELFEILRLQGPLLPPFQSDGPERLE